MIYKSSIDALNQPCFYHNKVFEELKKSDTVISFNYDLIAESFLNRLGKWSEFNGYRFYCPETLKKDYSVIKVMDNILYDPINYWVNDSYQFEDNLSEIILLKPHGSINWLLDNGSRTKENFGLDSPTFHEDLFGLKEIKGTSRIDLITLKNILNDDKEIIDWLPIGRIDSIINPFEKAYKADPKENWRSLGEIKFLSYKRLLFGPYIIASSIFKFNAPQPYEIIQIWSILKEALSKASRILFIGYSFRDTDLQFKTIFNLALKNKETIGGL